MAPRRGHVSNFVNLSAAGDQGSNGPDSKTRVALAAETELYFSATMPCRLVLEESSVCPRSAVSFGIVVQMYYADHDPPHFHVRYAGQKALIAIETLALLRGTLSPRALGLVAEWAALHRAELMEDWLLARSEAELNPIAPLE